jgi:LysM repeat protein
MGVSSITNTATASGGEAQASSPASTTITNSSFQGNITPSVTPGPSNLTRGSTIQHQVVKGEWLVQIARCYGVEYKNLRNANLQIPNPSLIEPGLVVTVPNIGSAGTIYGPPCVVFHTVAAGDTWNSIATRYNARVDVLQEANPSGLVTGAQIKVPINSAGAGAAQIPATGGATSTSTPTPTATSTPTVTATSGTGALGTTRITFAAGATSASVSGALVAHETISYVLAANQGQTMTATLSANFNDIAMKIYNPGGLLIKPLDGNLTWTGPLSATGDYRIDLVGLTDPTKNYTLTVTVTTP